MRVDAMLPVLEERLAVTRRDAPLPEVAALLAKTGHDLLVVCDGGGFALGVITRSDIVRHLGAAGSLSALAETMMVTSIVACSVTDDLMNTWQTMHRRGLNNVPVLNGRNLPVGILSERDALTALLALEQDQEATLIDYIAGFGYR
jgi:CBS domain-containing protein